MWPAKSLLLFLVYVFVLILRENLLVHDIKKVPSRKI